MVEKRHISKTPRESRTVPGRFCFCVLLFGAFSAPQAEEEEEEEEVLPADQSNEDQACEPLGGSPEEFTDPFWPENPAEKSSPGGFANPVWSCFLESSRL